MVAGAEGSFAVCRWISLRSANATDTSSFRMWCTNQTEYFDLRADPYELNNLDTRHADVSHLANTI
jgi:hypothetical protein